MNIQPFRCGINYREQIWQRCDLPEATYTGSGMVEREWKFFGTPAQNPRSKAACWFTDTKVGDVFDNGVSKYIRIS